MSEMYNIRKKGTTEDIILVYQAQKMFCDNGISNSECMFCTMNDGMYKGWGIKKVEFENDVKFKKLNLEKEETLEGKKIFMNLNVEFDHSAICVVNKIDHSIVCKNNDKLDETIRELKKLE